jgi:hypothetical protein
MPEGLKNVGSTLCRMTKTILQEQMHRNVFPYVDDIVVVIKKKSMQIDDLAETFANMCGVQLKLNPEKCVFGVQKGKVPGCLISINKIKANPDKINAIVHMQPPQSRKEVQMLTGRFAVLN